MIGVSRRRRWPLLVALLASMALHLALTVPFLVPLNLFAVDPGPPDPIPVELVMLPPPAPAEEEEEAQSQPEPQEAPQPPPAAEPPPPPPPPAQAEPPPPDVSPQQIVIATRDVATPPQGDGRETAAAEPPEPQQEAQSMPAPEPVAAEEAAREEESAEAPPEPDPPLAPPPPDPAPQEPQQDTPPPAPPPPVQAAPAPPPPQPPPPRPDPPRPEPPRAQPAPPPPDREVTGAIALARPQARPPDQITAADHRMPPVVVRPTPPGRAGNSLMPSYPSAARANGLQGRVVLLVTLSVEGRPRRIDIARSSGYDQLDESAVRAVWLWRFYRTDSGPPMEATIEIPLDFRL